MTLLRRPNTRARRTVLVGAGLAALVGTALVAPVSSAAEPPTYRTYTAPAGIAQDAAEPTLGSNWKTGAVLYQAGTETAKVTFDDAATATWTDASYPGAAFTLDPILQTDSESGRTFTSQLLAACSIGATTTNDGASYTPSQGCGIGTIFDHQTVGVGNYPANLAALRNPLNAGKAWYYCAQVILEASCARSDDGGTTFGPGVVAHDAVVDGCAGLHGHLMAAPDGTVYLPNFNCRDRVANAVSSDGGLTWETRLIPQSRTQDESDPSTAVGSDGTVYTGWQHGADNNVGSKPFIAVSRDKGATWSEPVDVGAAFGINNVQFPEVIAGDGDRAAFAFLGTPTAGNDQAADFRGVWHLYIATTYDRGVTWTTVDATPTDPVQRGCIWLAGGGVPCRNLLDFNDITVDKQGRVLAAYADGCVGRCVTTPPASYPNASGEYREDVGAIARQSGGLGLFKALDPAPATVLEVVTGKGRKR